MTRLPSLPPEQRAAALLDLARAFKRAGSLHTVPLTLRARVPSLPLAMLAGEMLRAEQSGIAARVRDYVARAKAAGFTVFCAGPAAPPAGAPRSR